ncbi:hypothetical protein J4227_06810 [Candidatus Woesearchaeota archaeon]|nr:hypothetical protein [Candidatus Woesearchaeota archaeon]
MKKPISATIEEDLISWVDREISARNKYRNRSHLIEIAIDLLRKQEKKEEKR